MLYEIGQSYLPMKVILSAILFITVLAVYLLFMRFIKKQNNYSNSSLVHNIGKLFGGVVIVFAGICAGYVFCENAYCVHLYKTQKCSVIEGTVNNFQYLYANNSYIINGITFDINEQKFRIQNGIFNTGYSVDKNIITGNDNNFKIYYVDYGDDSPIRTILRIDSVNE